MKIYEVGDIVEVNIHSLLREDPVNEFAIVDYRHKLEPYKYNYLVTYLTGVRKGSSQRISQSWLRKLSTIEEFILRLELEK